MKRQSTFGQRRSEAGPSAGNVDGEGRKRPVAPRSRKVEPEAARASILRQDLAPGDLMSVLRRLFGK
jgi:hypothetical protein